MRCHGRRRTVPDAIAHSLTSSDSKIGRPAVRRVRGPDQPHPANQPAAGILRWRRIPSIRGTSYPEATGPRISGQQKRALRQRPLAECGGNYVGLHIVEQIVAQRVSGGVGPAPGVDLAVDVVDVAFHGPDAQHQFIRHLPAALAHGDEAQHLHFPLGQTVGQR